jgi:arylsulfatase A-like enzyme
MLRQAFRFQFWLAWIATSGLGVSAEAAESFAPSRPNIVMMIADDLGAEDCGPYGHGRIQTPHLDRLAREGLRFDRVFLTCSSCSPSRSSLITGRYPHGTGASQLHQPLPAEQVTFVERLKAAGYHTAAAGKWHLGPAVRDRFDLVREGGGPSGCENWVPVLRDRPRDKPFFLWLAAIDPHRDYQPNAIPNPHRPEDAIVPPYLPDTPEVRADLARYYDEIARLDGFVGAVLDELDAQGIANETVVVFLTDNGRPFPRCKTTVYDSGIRTPLLVRWPGRVRPGGTSGALVSSIDLGPTFLELAGLTPGPTFQGQSFARVLDDPSTPAREHVFAEHNWHDFDDHQRAVRSARFKYIRTAYTDVPQTPPADAVRSPTFQTMRRLRDANRLSPEQSGCFVAPRPAEELYDLDADPHELRNLAADPRHAETLAQLRAELDRWIDATTDRIPAQRTPDGFDRETGQRLTSPRRPAAGN